MVSKIFRALSLLFFIVLFTGGTGPIATADSDAVISVMLQPVNKNSPVMGPNVTPVRCPLKLSRIHGHSKIVIPPETTARVGFLGEIGLGIPARTFAILFVLEEKSNELWVDGDGDGDFSEETPIPLLTGTNDRGQNSFYAAAPLVFAVNYASGSGEYQVSLRFDLMVTVISQTNDDEDYCLLQARTWFGGVISVPGTELSVALIDTNNNGLYHDPVDMIYLDTDYDLSFSLSEGKAISSQKSLKLGTGLYQFDYQSCPEKLILKKG